jgi:hypothetical protein
MTTTNTHVVAIGVLNECEGIVRDLIDEWDALMIRGMVGTSLKYATVTMSGNLNTVSGYSIVNKLTKRIATSTR